MKLNKYGWWLAVLVLPLAVAQAQRVRFDAEFAPSENFIKPAEEPYRRQLCLSGTWQFQPQAVPGDYKEGSGKAPELAPPVSEGWEKVPIRIPSPWNVNSFADNKGLGGDYLAFPSYPADWTKVKMGWLRKTFTIPADWKGKRIVLRFDAVAGDAQVLLNGRLVGSHFEIFLPFELDATDVAVIGGENELLVGVRKPSLFDYRSDTGRRPYQGGSFWGQHIAGIWQDVFVAAVPVVGVSDVFVQPKVGEGVLEVEVTLSNVTSRAVSVTVGGTVLPWVSKAGGDVLGAPLPSSELAAQPVLSLAGSQVSVPANGEARVVLRAPVRGELKLWSPGAPNLYGLVVKVGEGGGGVADSKYTRFGWRQFTFKDGRFCLNGEPFVMKGDSWHFMGIPQMTRRYAWAWYKSIRDAHLNAVRLHAQPYPSFYLDVADEMGVLVLDETAVWASDGGPKLDDPAFWKSSEDDLQAQILRDRNHPSVFGWSVSNEVHPIVRGVMRNPPGMMENLVRHYAIWRDICYRLDPTRQWVSADGENDGDGQLPAYMVHYGGNGAMERAFKSGKPWGVGEASQAYYGTPQQVSEFNGSRAYESFEGRMEGVAINSYESLSMQHRNHASYCSVFNLAWYGFAPLALGMGDTTRAPVPGDGVFFTQFRDGRPGVQPERLGPYTTTFNPGYDPSLPLNQPWAMFDAVRDASSEPPARGKWSEKTGSRAVVAPTPAPVSSLKVLGGANGKLAMQLKVIGVPVDKLGTGGAPDLLFIDGVTPPDASARGEINRVLQRGGTVLVWGADETTIDRLNALLPTPLTVSKRVASSLLAVGDNPLTANLSAADLYFSELRPSTITELGLGGPLAEQGTVLLKAADVDWTLWNKQAEYAKTAMIVRSEREAKPPGAVLVEKKIGAGRLLATTLPASPRITKAEKVDRTLLANLGVPLEGGMDAGKPLLKTGILVRALACGYFPVPSIKETAGVNPVDPASDNIREKTKTGDREWKKVEQENGNFNVQDLKLQGFQSNIAAYLSFWVYSPRPLDNLLLEPNMPVVNLETAQNDAVQAWLNGKPVINNIRTGPAEGGKSVAEGLKLQQGWNHILIKLTRAAGGWDFTARLTSNQPEFIIQLDSALEKP
jgi:beta-galactosidase